MPSLGGLSSRRPCRTVVDTVVTAVAASVLASPAWAGAHTAAEVEAFAERAVEHFHAAGREQAFADFNRPDGGFVDGDLYIFCRDSSGVVVAHGGNPKIVGRNMSDVLGPDGRQANVDINRIGLGQGGGWLEYRWPNPATRLIETKASYVLKADDRTVCGSGYYKGSTPQGDVLKRDVPKGDAPKGDVPLGIVR